MKKNKKHKWKYNINVKKKALVLIILGVLMFVGLGFSILESNLGLGGTLEVNKYDKTLQAVVKRSVNKGNAQKYIGVHQDSMDATKSTEDIYHFNASSTDFNKASSILNENNVVFADECWQIIRTTDTGGTRLLYNGVPEKTEVDGQIHYNCGTTRNAYEFRDGRTTLDLAGTYIYGSDYTASTYYTQSGMITTGTQFTLLNPQSFTIDENTTAEDIANIVENYPYTCKSTTNRCQSIAYKVEGQDSGTTMNVEKTSYVYDTGSSEFNTTYGSPSYSGYMYGDIISSNYVAPNRSLTLTKTKTLLYSSTWNNNHWYSDTFDWNNLNANKYTLVNPTKISDATDYPNLINKYTFRQANSSYSAPSAHGIVAVVDSTVYTVQLSGGRDLSSYNTLAFGEDIADNGDGTYSLVNSNPINISAWTTDYANYVGKYTCGDASTSCAKPQYITAATTTNYTYMEGVITIAKEVDGLELKDYIKIGFGEWYNNYSTYSSYNYSCGDDSIVCTAASLIYIYRKNQTSYNYYPNRYFGTSVEYDEDYGVYKLKDTIGLENSLNYSQLATHHYTCPNTGDTECSTIAFIYYVDRTYANQERLVYVSWNNPDLTDLQDVNDSMFKNTNDSNIKTKVEEWYENHIKDTIYESKIEDTIYCQNRSIDQASGWSETGNITSNLSFTIKNNSTDLDCPNVADRFSVSNNDAKLKYPIALMTVPEANLLENGDLVRGYNMYWLLSPSVFQYRKRQWYVPLNYLGYSYAYQGSASSKISSDYTYQNYNIRPVISLIAGTEYSRGDGSTTNPYVVDMGE